MLFKIDTLEEFQLFIFSKIDTYEKLKERMFKCLEKDEDSYFFRWNGTEIQVAAHHANLANGWKKLLSEKIESLGVEEKLDVKELLEMVEKASYRRISNYAMTRPGSRSTSPSANLEEDAIHLFFLEVYDLIQKGK